MKNGFNEMKNKEVAMTNTTAPGIFKTEFEKILLKKIDEFNKY